MPMSIVPFGLISVQRMVRAISKVRLYAYYLGQKRARRITAIVPYGENFQITYITNRGAEKTKVLSPNTLVLAAFYDISGEPCEDVIAQAQAAGDTDRLETLSRGFPGATAYDVSYVCG